MELHDWKDLIEQLDRANVKFAAGLTDEEVRHTEKTFGFVFPADLRSFLQTASPVGWHFPDWSSGDEDKLREWLALPLEGILFDVEHKFWLPEWGKRPEQLSEALEVATTRIKEAPKLIPVFGHRFMPEFPSTSGNPVLSVHQTDIIYYGFDLDDYLRHEFSLPGRAEWPEKIKQIEFWDIDRFQEIRWAE